MGMSYEQYWEQDPYLAIAYRKAHRLKREAENEYAWLQGIYIYDAFAVVLANAFKKRGTKDENYFERPIDIFPLTAEEKEQRAQAEIEKSQQALQAMMQKRKQKSKPKGD